MMKTIWKTVLSPIDVQEIEVPAGSEFLCAAGQHEKICVWYRCDPDAAKETRKIAIVGTGHNAPDDGHYLGSAMMHGGNLVFHIFVRQDLIKL